MGSANCNDKQHVCTFWGRQRQSMVMFMPTLSWGNRGWHWAAAAAGRGVQGARGEESRVASLPQIAFNYVACCSRFYGPLLTCLQTRVAARVPRVVACGMFVLMICAGSDQRIYLWQLLQLQLRSAFSTSAATHCHAPSLPSLLVLSLFLFVFMTLILIIDSSIKMFHYARRAAQEPAANCLRKCATPPSLHFPASPVLAASSAACEFAAFKNKLKRELCQTC